VINYKTKTDPWGVGGGNDGVRNKVIINPGEPNEESVGVSNNEFGTGGKITNLTGGGGGWGNAFEREPAKVLHDVIEGYVSVEGAKRDYGVVITGSPLSVDEKATSELRATLVKRS
jgi:N-methylhydantoinase B